MSQQLEEPPRVGYWKTHELHRMHVELVKGFVGYDLIMQLIDMCFDLRDKAFLAALFLTGGRVNEVLKLTMSNFRIFRSQNRLEVEGMYLSKRYRREWIDKEQKTYKVVKLKGVTRDPFPIRLDEPPSAILLEWIEECKKNDQELLFLSPYKGKKKEYSHLTRHWAYKLVRKLDGKMSRILHRNLGLNEPLIDVKTGQQVKDKLNLWLHWFRSQRACCLVAVFGFEVMELVEWFKWKDVEMAIHYAKLGAGKLADKMNEVAQEELM